MKLGTPPVRSACLAVTATPILSVTGSRLALGGSEYSRSDGTLLRAARRTMDLPAPVGCTRVPARTETLGTSSALCKSVLVLGPAIEASHSILRPYRPAAYRHQTGFCGELALLRLAIGVSMNHGQTTSAPARGVAFLIT